MRTAEERGFRTDAFPGTGGEITLSAHQQEHELEFCIEPDGAVGFCHEIGDEELEWIEGLSMADVLAKIQGFEL